MKLRCIRIPELAAINSRRLLPFFVEKCGIVDTDPDLLLKSFKINGLKFDIVLYSAGARPFVVIS